MKIVSNCFAISPIKSEKINFQGVGVGDNSENNVEKSYTTPVMNDYSVNLPISYKFVDNIKLPNGLEAKYYKLANGQKVVLVHKKGPTIVKTYVNTGSMNEPDKLRGISHFIEHNLFNGSESLGDKVFFDEVSKMGANTNASTSLSYTDYYINSPILEAGDLENDIMLHSGMLQSPKFLEEKLEKEKKIVNSEINMCLSDSESIGYTSTLKNLFNIKTSSKDLIAGTTDNITEITREDVVNYYRNNYYPANMTTVITGDIDEKDTMKLVSKYFTSDVMPKTPRHYEKFEPIEKSVRTDIISPKVTTDVASVFMGFTGPKNSDVEDDVKVNALLILLSLLNNSRTTDTEVAYSSHITPQMERVGTRPTDPKMIMLSVDVPEQNCESVIGELYKNIASIVANPPTEDEMCAIRNKMKKAHNEIFESSETINQTIGEAFLDGDYRDLNKISSLIDKLKSEDIVETAKKYLDLNKVSLTVIHPSTQSEQKINRNYDKANGLLKKAFDLSNVEEKVLKNNVSVVYNDIQSDNVQMAFTIKNPVKKPSNIVAGEVLTVILNHYGTNSMSQTYINNILDKNAMDLFLKASPKSIDYVAAFPVTNFESSVKLIGQILKDPCISEDSLQFAKKYLKDKYLMRETSPYELYDKFMIGKATFKDKLAALDKLTTDDVKQYYEQLKDNAQVNLVISAPFSKNPALKSIVEEELSGYKNLQEWKPTLIHKYKPVDKTVVIVSVNNKNQSQILEGFKFPYSGDVKEQMALVVLNHILGGSASSRLFSDLREKRHLAYNVNSRFNYKNDQGILTLQIKTTTNNMETGENTFDNIEKSIRGFNENILSLKNEKVSEQELLNAKKAVKADIMSIENNLEKNIVLKDSKNTIYGINYINDQLEALDDITSDDVIRVAQKVFSTKPVYSLSGTPSALEANKDFLKSLKDS